jgi:hypothetical protein
MTGTVAPAMPASSLYRQTFDAQLEELRDAGCIKMYRENVRARTTTGVNRRRCSITSRLASVLRVTRIETPLAECRPSNSHRFGIGS